MRKSRILIMGCALSLSACAVDTESSSRDELARVSAPEALRYSKHAPIVIDERRSLAVTEQPILARFSFKRVLTQLVSQANVPELTATKLFQQWWDTQNPNPGVGNGEHCDDVVDPVLGPVVNGYPYTCRPAPAEGAQASCDPFNDAACSYIPIGLFNRFELAPEDGAHCGEYRIVFAKTTGLTTPIDRNLLIFEAALPNPQPRLGLAGCRPIASYWAELSQINDLKERARRLERFYFTGIGHGIPPVVHIQHYGDNKRSFGQVRTNQFMQTGVTKVWSLREFKLRKQCTLGRYRGRFKHSCTLTFDPDTNKVNPFGPLFSDTGTHPQTSAFQRAFVNEVEDLAAGDVNAIRMTVENRFNSGQSQASQSTETNYPANFEDEGDFAADIEDELNALGSTLEPADIVARAQTQACAGCHRFSNDADLGAGLVWPASLGFTHVAEADPETLNGVTRFRLSAALTTAFLPHRKQVLEDFLAGRWFPRGYGTLGGQTTH